MKNASHIFVITKITYEAQFYLVTK
jgi:hypothetical protein